MFQLRTHGVFAFPQRRREYAATSSMCSNRSKHVPFIERKEMTASHGWTARKWRSSCPHSSCQLERQAWAIFILLCSKRSQVITFFYRLKTFLSFLMSYYWYFIKRIWDYVDIRFTTGTASVAFNGLLITKKALLRLTLPVRSCCCLWAFLLCTR